MARLALFVLIAVGVAVAVANPVDKTEAKVGATMEHVLAVVQKAVEKDTHHRMKRSTEMDEDTVEELLRELAKVLPAALREREQEQGLTGEECPDLVEMAFVAMLDALDQYSDAYLNEVRDVLSRLAKYLPATLREIEQDYGLTGKECADSLEMLLEPFLWHLDQDSF